MWPRGPSTRDIGIVCIGDSHLGQMPIVTSGNSVVGLYPINGARDKDWTGTADNAYFRANNGLADATGTTDPNLGSTSPASFSMLLPGILRRSSPRFGRIRIANFGIGGSSCTTWSGNCSTGYVTCATNPQAGDTVTVGSVTYTFRASATLANEVTIGGTNILTAINLGHAINGESTGFGAGTVANPDVFSGIDRADNNTMCTSVKVGALGNATTLSTVSGGRITFLTTFTNGGASPLFTNMVTKVPAGFGSVDAVLIALGTNDAVRLGWRGRGYQTHLMALVANLKAQWPTAKIVMWKPPVNAGGAANTAALTDNINPAIAAVVAADSQCSLVDMYAVGAGSGSPLVLCADGTHLTGYGYSIVAELFGGAIASALGMA